MVQHGGRTCCWLLSRRSAICRTEPFEDDGVLVCIESLLKSLVLRESDPSATPESEQLCTRAAMAGDRAIGVQGCVKGLSTLAGPAINAQVLILRGEVCFPAGHLCHV
jgi:hypothetical protein